MLDATTEMVVYSRDVTWQETREALISPARTSETGTGNHAPTPEYVFIPPPAAAPISAPAAASLPPTVPLPPATILPYYLRLLLLHLDTFVRARAERYTWAADAPPPDINS